jgi:hypothetical protein
MENNVKFSIEYVQPGIVRSGRRDCTDFCLLYHENKNRLYFFGVGIWEKDVLVGYEIRIPKELKEATITPSFFNRKDLIISRIKNYIESKDFKWHRNVSIEQY